MTNVRNHDDDYDDLYGSDGSEWMEEVSKLLVQESPLTTPQKPKGKDVSRSETVTRTVKASTARPSSPSSTRSEISSETFRAPVGRPSPGPSRLQNSGPPMTPTRSNKPDVKGAQEALTRLNISKTTERTNEPIWISSDSEYDTATESDTDSLFDEYPSRQTTMSSIGSLPSPTKNNPLARPDNAFPSSSKTPRSIRNPIPQPQFCDAVTVSPAMSTASSSDDWDDPCPSRNQSSVSANVADAATTSATTCTDALKNMPSFSESAAMALFDSGLKVNHYIIAHDGDVQKLFDSHEVPWGTQYELARGVSQGKWVWGDIPPKIEEFGWKSDEEVLHLVYYIMKDLPHPKWPQNDIGKEFDREQLAILEDRQRGLGLMGLFFGEENWFGGQIQQIATLRATSPYKPLSLYLDGLEMRRSTRFARHFGSRRVLQVRIEEDLLRGPAKDRVVKFLSQKFILNGRVFAPTPPKENTLYLVETNENYEREPVKAAGDHLRKSLGQILDWHNPMKLNANQPISKHSARAALALSNSVPALLFDVDEIRFIDDVLAPDWEGDAKPPAHKVLTDGCGFINDAAMRLIARQLNYPVRPTAAQGRIAGSKGLWTIHPEDTSEVPKIWIRDSQRKIVYPHYESETGRYTSLNREHRIFDLVHVALPSISCPIFALKKQAVLNLSSNGIPARLFEELMRKGLQDVIEPLVTWDGPFAMASLWDTINKIGRVSHTRMGRCAAGLGRAMGLSGRHWGKAEFGSGENANVDDKGSSASFISTQTGRNELSGAPLGLHETALELTQAGFHPATDSIHRRVIRQVMKTAVDLAIDKCHIPLPEGSAVEAFVIPDPLGILKEDEVYYRSSTPMTDPVSQTFFHVVTGDVLIGRYPLRVRSDIQKVRAVDIPKLSRWSDVIIVPIKASSEEGYGQMSLMSKCSGGDADGDVLFMISHKAMVDRFEGSSFVLPPKDLDDYFESRRESVAKFISRLGEDSIPSAQIAFLQTILSGLNDSNVGLYDLFHERAVRCNGYDSRTAVRLAYLFNELLDAAKTGKVLRPEVLRDDVSRSNRFKATLDERARQMESPSSSQHSTPFIFDELESFGRQLLKEHERKFDEMPKSEDRSKVLLAPYNSAVQRSQTRVIHPETQVRLSMDSSTAIQALQQVRLAELKAIEDHVRRAYQEFCRAARRSTHSQSFFGSPSKVKKTPKGRSDQTDIMYPATVLYAKDVPGIEETQDVERVKASFAYSLSENFAKTVAFRTLCEIQVFASSEGGAPCSRLLDQVKSVSGAARRLFAQPSV